MTYDLPRMKLGLLFGLCWATCVTGTGALAQTETHLEGGLVASAAVQLAQIPNFEAKIRQRVFLFDQELIGSGIYRQRTANGLRMLRLEIRLQGGGGMTSLQQVSDGRTLWIRQDTGVETRLSYVNLRTLQNALNASSPGSSPPQIVPLQGLVIGGLPQLIDELNQHFEFGEPVETTLGELPVWVLTGSWKAAALKQLYPQGIPAAEHWPPQMPERVSITLGRDQQLPLFPYRVIYSRFERTLKGELTDKLAPMAAIEFFEVRPRPDLDARHFSYQPHDQEVIDATPLFLNRLARKTAPNADAAAAASTK